MPLDNSRVEDDEEIEILPVDPEELFEELETAGSGNYGSVIKARNRVTDEVVAIKQILISDAEELENIRKEIAIMKKSEHPNVVRYHGTYRSLGKLWIAMEYCEGGSVDLVHKILRRPLPEKLLAYVCREVLLGLQYLHQHKRIHRDIKGSNILLTRDGQVKLADFGVSTELKHSMSRRNTFIGTVLWMAPEAIQEAEYNDKADLWSLGITAIEMAENGPPHSGMHLARALFQIPRDDPPTLRHRDQWSPSMNVFVKRLLTKDKNIRPNATTMLADPFVQEENVGTAAELAAIVGELIERRAKMDSARLRQGDFSSDASRATFVERRSTVGNGSDDGITDASPGGPMGGGAGPSGGIGAMLGGGIGGGIGGDDLPSFFTDGTLLPLPVLSTQDIDLDHVTLSMADMGSAEEEADRVFAMLGDRGEVARHSASAVAAGARVPTHVTHTTRVVARAHQRTLQLLTETRLPREEEARLQANLEKYAAILSAVYHI